MTMLSLVKMFFTVALCVGKILGTQDTSKKGIYKNTNGFRFFLAIFPSILQYNIWGCKKLVNRGKKLLNSKVFTKKLLLITGVINFKRDSNCVSFTKKTKIFEILIFSL